MKFIHDDSDFESLIAITAKASATSQNIVEKDYWVAHALWALQDSGLELWFKGGTSLSKGFDLIHRFSEDLDLKIEPGKVKGLPNVSNWKSDGPTKVAERKAFFIELGKRLEIPGATVELDDSRQDGRFLTADFKVMYPMKYGGPLRPFVLLEIGDARVAPFVRSDMDSFIHKQLTEKNMASLYIDNTPKAIRCVHPAVTLLEKIDAIQKRAINPDKDPAEFVRHYEDAASIIRSYESLPPLEDFKDVKELAGEMADQHQIKELPNGKHAGILLEKGERRAAIENAYDKIAEMFWKERIPLDEACECISAWAQRTFS